MSNIFANPHVPRAAVNMHPQAKQTYYKRHAQQHQRNISSDPSEILSDIPSYDHSSSEESSDYSSGDSVQILPNCNQRVSDIGYYAEKFVSENPSDHPLVPLYDHLLNIQPPKYNGRWSPFKNGIHFLLYLTGRSHSFILHSQEKIMNHVIQLLHTMAKCSEFIADYGPNGIFDEHINLEQELPTNWATIKNYDNYIPTFPVSKLNIAVQVKVDKPKSKQGTAECKQAAQVVPDNVEYYPHEKPTEVSPFQSNIYNEYETQLFELHYQNPLWKMAMWNLTGPDFLQSLNCNFRQTCPNFPQTCHRFSNKCHRCLDFNVTGLESSQWIEYHNILQHGDYIPELKNKTVIFKNDLLLEVSDTHTLFYVYNINVGLNKSLKKCVNSTQNAIKESYDTLRGMRPVYQVECQVIRKCGAETARKWCIVGKAKHFIDYDSNFRQSCVPHSQIRHKMDAQGSIQLTDALKPPQYQTPAVSKRQPYIFWNYSHDGKPVGGGLNTGLEMSYLSIGNSKHAKDDHNIVRFSVTDKKIPNRYILALVCQELKHLRPGLNFLVKHRHARSGYIQKISGELALTLGDLDSIKPDVYSPKCSTLNRNDGKTFLATDASQALKFPHHHARTLPNLIHPRTKLKLHQFVHHLLVVRRVDPAYCRQQRLRLWAAYPTGLASRAFGVSNDPSTLYVDYHKKQYVYNFQLNAANCFFHNVSTPGALMDLCWAKVLKQYSYDNLPNTYNSLKDMYLAENVKSHAVNPLSMLQYQNLFKLQQMHHTFAKWFFCIICFSTLFGNIEYIQALISYLNAITSYLQVRSERQRKKVKRKCKQAYQNLTNVGDASVMNKPKTRILKDIIDIDAFFFANPKILQNLFTEFAHQKNAVIHDHRDNFVGSRRILHSRNQIDINSQHPAHFKWFSTEHGIAYALQGGLWSTQLQHKMGPACIALKDPKNSMERHPLINSFLQKTFHSQVLELCHQTHQGRTFSSNQFPTILFKLFSCYLQYDKYIIHHQNTPLNHLEIKQKIKQHTTKFWSNFMNDEVMRILANELSLAVDSIPTSSMSFECTPVQKLIVNKSHKSNILHICSHEKDYYKLSNTTHIWLKVAIPEYRIMDLSRIWRVLHIPSQEIRYLAFGTLYRYSKMTNSTDYASNGKHSDWLPHFDKTRDLLPTKWCIANSSSILESVFLTHEHTFDYTLSPYQPLSQNNFRWQINWVQYMHNRYSRYMRSFLARQHNLPQSVPCGPYRICTVHKVIDDCSHYKVNWICNTVHNQIFVIWDAEHSFLPGLWRNCLSKIQSIH